MEVVEFWQRKGFSSLTAVLPPRFSLFFLENPSFGMLTILKTGKDLNLHKNGEKTQKSYTKS